MKKYTYLIVIVLTVATLVAFGRIAGNDFINFDDEGYITGNNHIKSGINPESITWAFKTVVLHNWVPLAMLSHMMDWSLFGGNASGHHLMSLLFHIGAVIFLFLFLYKTTGNLWPSAFAAAFFALHPLRVESVAWASERKDVLSMFFGMASLWAYAFYAEKPKVTSYIACLILFALSLLAKSMLITLPFVLLLIDYWPLGRWTKETSRSKRLIIEKIPFFVLTITFSIITFLVQYEANTTYPSLAIRMTNATVAYVAYLGKTIWPVNLTLNYFYIYSFETWQIMTSLFILSIITIIVLYSIRKRPYLLVGWFWYLGTLVPVIGLVPTSALLADHYTYLPSIGIAIILSWGIPSLIKREAIRKQLLFPAAIILLVFLMVLTWHQCGYWKNDIKLFSYALQITKNNHIAHAIRGNAYNLIGDYHQAIKDSTEAIRLKPDNPGPYTVRGNAYNFIGNYHQAIKDSTESIRLNPDNPGPYNVRGNAYYKLGRYERAIEDYNEAIRIESHDVEGYGNRGNIYYRLGQYQLAIDDYSEAAKLKSDDAEGYYNRGNAYAKLGRYQHAIEDYNKAIGLKPDYAYAYYNRGNLYVNFSKYQLAIEDYSKAIAVNNNFAKSYNNRGVSYYKLGQYQVAISDYSKAIGLKPDYAEAYYNRANVYFHQGNYKQCCLDARKACDLGMCTLLKKVEGKKLCR